MSTVTDFAPGTRVTFPVVRGGSGPVTYARGVVVPGPSYATSFRMVRVDTGGTPAVIEVRCLDLLPEGEHAAYPHEPGTLYDCPACETACHCGPGVAEGRESECIWPGHEGGEE